MHGLRNHFLTINANSQSLISYPLLCLPPFLLTSPDSSCPSLLYTEQPLIAGFPPSANIVKRYCPGLLLERETPKDILYSYRLDARSALSADEPLGCLHIGNRLNAKRMRGKSPKHCNGLSNGNRKEITRKQMFPQSE